MSYPKELYIMSNEMLFYTGLAVSILSVVGGVTSLFVNKIRALKLKGILDEEYGKDKKDR